MDEYAKRLERDVKAHDAKIAAELIAKAEKIEHQVKSGEKSRALLATAKEHRAIAASLLKAAA
jgi:hypothetical protein